MASTTRVAKTAVVFDLDDTLIHSATFKVPKQTFHFLKKLKKRGVHLAVISANPRAKFFTHVAGLGKYIDAVVEETDVEETDVEGDEQKHQKHPLRLRQFLRALQQLSVDASKDTVFYADDGQMHLTTIAKTCTHVKTFWCESPLTLHKPVQII